MPRASGPSGVPTPLAKAEGHILRTVMRGAQGPRAVRRPHACTEPTCTGTGRSHVCLPREGGQAASGSPRTHADDERTREVGQPRTTWEAAEQGQGTGRGGGGGKGAGQGEEA